MVKTIVFLFLSIPLCFAQQTDTVDFLEIDATVEIDTVNYKVNGSVEVKFKALKNTDSVYLDGVQMNIKAPENSPFKIVEEDNKIWITSNFKKEHYTARFWY